MKAAPSWIAVQKGAYPNHWNAETPSSSPGSDRGFQEKNGISPMVTQTPHKRNRKTPVVATRALRSNDRKSWILMVDDCPFCGLKHAHGGGDGPQPAYGVRASHCADLDLRTGYDLRPAVGK